MTKNWVLGVDHSPVCQVLLQIVVRAVINPLHLFGLVMLECCRLQLTSLSSVNVLQPPFLCEELGGHPLSVWGQFSIDRSPLAL